MLDSLARNELSEIHDRKELQRLVVTAEFDDDNDGDIDSETVVMPQGVTIERLRGIKWKKRWQPKRIEQRLQQEMIAFNAKQLAQVAANGGGAGDSSSSSSDSEDEHGRRVPMTLASGADGGVNVIAASGSTGTTQEMSEEALMFSFINKYCITSDKFTTTKDFIEYAHHPRLWRSLCACRASAYRSPHHFFFFFFVLLLQGSRHQAGPWLPQPLQQALCGTWLGWA